MSSITAGEVESDPGRSDGDGMPGVHVGLLVERQDLLAIDRDVARRLDADPDLIAVDLHDRDHDAIPDHDLLVHLAAQDQHDFLPVEDRLCLARSVATRSHRPLDADDSCAANGWNTKHGLCRYVR